MDYNSTTEAHSLQPIFGEGIDGEEDLFVHLFIQSKADLKVSGRSVQIEQTTNYPFSEEVDFSINLASPIHFTLAIRIPSWCEDATVFVNDQPIIIEPLMEQGYVRITREWKNGDRVRMRLPMSIMCIEAHPRVRHNNGRYALQRGPMIYCLEEVDNFSGLDSIRLTEFSKFEVSYDSNLLQGTNVIRGQALRRITQDWDNILYRQEGKSVEVPVTITAIPYYLWANRGLGEMLVWIRGICAFK